MFYKVSRFSKFHNFLRRCLYMLLWRLPDKLKYQIFGKYLKSVKPYSLLKEGDIVIQVGAPWDILKSGRSRALHFARIVGGSGRVFAVEPVKESIDAMADFVSRLGITNMVQIPYGAWSNKETLSFLVDPEHPASNLIDDVYVQERTDMEKYQKISIDVDSLSNLLAGHQIEEITLLSLTTNGSEAEIYNGMGSELLAKTKFISVIDDPRQSEVYDKSLFEYYGEDDRGYILKNINIR